MIGDMVLYTLTEQDAKRASRDDPTYRQMSGTGNHVRAGDVFPAVVVRDFPDDTDNVNLSVVLDGSDSLWVTSAARNDEQEEKPGTWQVR